MLQEIRRLWPGVVSLPVGGASALRRSVSVTATSGPPDTLDSPDPYSREMSSRFSPLHSPVSGSSRFVAEKTVPTSISWAQSASSGESWNISTSVCANGLDSAQYSPKSP